MRKYRNDVINLIFNVGGFGLYIFSQQVILMPALSKIVSERVFSIVVLSLTVMNIFATIVGEDLGNIRILNLSLLTYKFERFFNMVLLNISLIGAIVLSFLVGINSHFNTLEYALLAVVLVISSLRFYYTTLMRSIENYKDLFIGSLLYCMVVLISTLFLGTFSKRPLILLGFGEVVSLIYFIFRFKNNCDQDETLGFDKKKILTQYLNLSLSSIFLNLSVYLDRFIIIPLIGIDAVGLYYSVSSMSKILSLLVNPLSNWLLVKLNKSKEKSVDFSFLNYQRLIIVAFLSFIVILSYVSSYVGIIILYPENISDVVISLLLPIAIVTTGSIASSLMKPIILTKLKPQTLLISNVIYMLTFSVLAVILSEYFSIIGFAYANAIGRMVQLSANLIFFRRRSFDLST